MTLSADLAVVTLHLIQAVVVLMVIHAMTSNFATLVLQGNGAELTFLAGTRIGQTVGERINLTMVWALQVGVSLHVEFNQVGNVSYAARAVAALGADELVAMVTSVEMDLHATADALTEGVRHHVFTIILLLTMEGRIVCIATVCYPADLVRVASLGMVEAFWDAVMVVALVAVYGLNITDGTKLGACQANEEGNQL